MNIFFILLVIGCQRSKTEVWEDTKTAGRYVNKGFLSLIGVHGDSRQVTSLQEFTGPPEEDFVPLRDEEYFKQLTLGDNDALKSIDAYSNIPQSHEAPGEKGSAIPGINNFHDPAETGTGNIFKLIHFAYNDYNVNSEKYLKTIRSMASYMKKNSNTYIFVEGHCDDRGSAAYNLALGTRRSNAVRNMLVKEGVDLNRIFTISYGKERPIALGDAAVDRAENRRAAFKIFTK